MKAELEQALCRRLGVDRLRMRSVSGGDINDAFRIECSLGSLFVKTNAHAPATLFSAEARGLEWLREARCLRIPEVRAVSEPHEPVRYLVLEFIEAGKPAADFDDELGRGLAALHRSGAPSFGLDHDNFIGSLPQANAPTPTWASFLRERRLEPQLRRAADAGLATSAMKRSFDRLFATIDDAVGPAEPPARLHGDLWAGNHLADEQGDPVLIDPACYGGHREVDLAMMRLFGGYGARVFAAYHEAFPLAPGVEDRVSLYQLYPLLVHVNLFGGSYVASVESALARIV